jgi:HD-GYP domain-containing protein (c-di-GMP phosphodiesterase class II)
MRILQIADVFSALTEERPYRRALAPSEALCVIEEELNAGKWMESFSESFNSWSRITI